MPWRDHVIVSKQVNCGSEKGGRHVHENFERLGWSGWEQVSEASRSALRTSLASLFADEANAQPAVG
jgi:hypothetical protein